MLTKGRKGKLYIKSSQRNDSSKFGVRTTVLRGALARSGEAAILLARELSNMAQNSNWRFGISMGDFYFLADFGVPDLG